MKRLYIGLNIILVVLIMSILVLPNPKNIKSNSLSKVLTTSIINSKEEEIIDKDNTNNIENIINTFSSEVNYNIALSKLDTDVLETLYGTMSGYGLDCKGCSGVVGARYDAKGNNLRYNDPTYGECRIVAGDKKFPYGTIVRVKDSKIGTFNAIILDRGGDIGIGRRYMFDLLFMTEKESYDFGLSKNTTFEILRYGY